MEKTEKNYQKLEKIVKDILSEILGIETTDISNSDSLREDLHMGSTDITDLIERLYQKGIVIEDDLLKEIDTVEELIEHIVNYGEF